MMVKLSEKMLESKQARPRPVYKHVGRQDGCGDVSSEVRVRGGQLHAKPRCVLHDDGQLADTGTVVKPRGLELCSQEVHGGFVQGAQYQSVKNDAL